MKRCKNCGEKFQPRFNNFEVYCWASECKTIDALQKLEKLKNITPSSSNFISASIIFFIQAVNIADLIFQL